MNCNIRVVWHGNPAQTGWINGPKRIMEEILSGVYNPALRYPVELIINEQNLGVRCWSPYHKGLDQEGVEEYEYKYKVPVGIYPA